MTKTVALAVTCTCKDKKQFIHSVEVERSQNGSDVDSIQVECPFRQEKNCSGQITVELPAGMKPTKSGIIFRN